MICSERQPGHPANTQHRPEGPVRSLPSDFWPCCKFNVLTSWGSLISTTVKLVRNRTSAGVGKRAWEQAAGCLPSLLLSSRSCIGNLLCHNHLLVNLVWWISDWRKNWLSRRITEWVADVHWGIPMESFWTWFGSQDGMGWGGVLTKIRCNIQNNFGGFWSLGKNASVWKACEKTLQFWLAFFNMPKTFFK